MVSAITFTILYVSDNKVCVWALSRHCSALERQLGSMMWSNESLYEDWYDFNFSWADNQSSCVVSTTMPGAGEVAAALFKALAMTSVIVATVCGNMLVIVSVLRFERLRIIANSFLVSLAVADLLVAVLVMPFNALQQVAGRSRRSPDVPAGRRTLRQVAGRSSRSPDASAGRRTFQQVAGRSSRLPDDLAGRRTFQQVAGQSSRSPDVGRSVPSSATSSTPMTCYSARRLCFICAASASIATSPWLIRSAMSVTWRCAESSRCCHVCGRRRRCSGTCQYISAGTAVCRTSSVTTAAMCASLTLIESTVRTSTSRQLWQHVCLW